jgi:hypothetical protein
VESQSLSVLEAVAPAVVGRVGDAETWAELGAVLEELATRRVFVALLDVLLEEGDLARLAALSYRHPNHFDKLVLADLSGGQKIVVHTWPAAPADRPHRDGNLHNHRWHFATRVLAGSYRFAEFEIGEADSPPLFYEHRYSVDPEGNHRLEEVGRCGLTVACERKLSAGDTYLLDSSVVHHIEMAHPEPTVTLFVQGPAVRSTTRVFSPTPLQQAGQVNPPRFSEDVYRHRLRELREVASGFPGLD